MYDEFHLFSKIAMLLTLTVIGIALFQSHRNQAVDVHSPRWLVVCMSPATVLTLAPILWSLWIVASTWLYGATTPNVVGLFMAAFGCYAFRAILHKGARVHMAQSERVLEWWIDTSGNLHPHFNHIKSPDTTHWIARKEQALSLLADLEHALQVGKPVVINTPFKLDYLATRLAKQGWKIERRPASRCPWIVRVVLLMRRGKLQLPLPSNGWRLKLPTRRDWRDLAMMHHAVLSPPGYPSVEITPPAARLLRD
ncbi:hypothetical protein D3C80_59810 [compost metagenome]